MSKMMFVNLPVKDLDASVAFFTELGFSFDPEFTDENASAMVVSDTSSVMLLAEPYFRSFTPGRELSDTKATTEVIVCIGLDSRPEVDELADKALALGGSPTREPQDHGFMYERSFQDLDGHLWEVMWMDPAAAQG